LGSRVLEVLWVREVRGFDKFAGFDRFAAFAFENVARL